MTLKKLWTYITGGLRQRWIRGSVLIVLAALLIVIVVFSVITYNYYYTTVRTGLEARAKTATDFFANYVKASFSYEDAYKYTDSFEDADWLEMQFLDVNGRVITSTYGITGGSSPNSPDIVEAITTGTISSWDGRRTATGERVMAVSAPFIYGNQEVKGVMRFVTSLKLVDAQVFKSILAICGVSAVILLVIIVMNLVFIRSVIEPVGEITKMSKRIADGSYGVQIKNKYNDEIGDMVHSINEMSMKIAQTEKIQTEFISSISHELRTPLTAITGWGETLVYNTQLDVETKRGIAIMLKEARRLTKMVEELLEFTRMQDGRFTLNIEQIDVAAELEDSIYAYRELLRQDEMELEYAPYEEDLPDIPGDASRLRQVFFNLMDNAAKYAREGKRIRVSVDVEGAFVAIRIRDYGSGIPEDELDNVRMKFYKGSNAKERGSGIGLAVCDEIIKYHGGVMELENAEGGGLLVTIRLPIGDETEAA